MDIYPPDLCLPYPDRETILFYVVGTYRKFRDVTTRDEIERSTER